MRILSLLLALLVAGPAFASTDDGREELVKAMTNKCWHVPGDGSAMCSSLVEVEGYIMETIVSVSNEFYGENEPLFDAAVIFCTLKIKARKMTTDEFRPSQIIKCVTDLYTKEMEL
jgi:hypothetical protein